MTPEEIKKLDFKLFEMRKQIISDIHSYNINFKRLEEARPSRFTYCSPSKFDGGREGVMGLALHEKLLSTILT